MSILIMLSMIVGFVLSGPVVIEGFRLVEPTRPVAAALGLVSICWAFTAGIMWALERRRPR